MIVVSLATQQRSESADFAGNWIGCNAPSSVWLHPKLCVRHLPTWCMSSMCCTWHQLHKSSCLATFWP